MQILFSKAGKHCYLADKKKMIFCVDDVFYNTRGEEVPAQESFYHDKNYDNTGWYQDWMDDEGLPEPLKAESTVEPECEIDDIFGNFGFKNQAGVFIIEPQYAYAHDFTNGLAAVNLNRTWYRTPEGQRYYENHCGYIDGNGKTVIGFQYDEAYPFNKYGVALVSDRVRGWFLIDMQGNEIPGTRFPYISRFDYDERYIEFSSEDSDDALVGIYDTKERKVLIEPCFEEITIHDDKCILVWERNQEYGYSDFRQYYLNMKGELMYPWLDTQEFAIIQTPDINDVAAVAISQYSELMGTPRSYFEYKGKKYERKFVYGLYSSRKEFIFPLEFEMINRLAEDIWKCYKDGVFTIVKTEPND